MTALRVLLARLAGPLRRGRTEAALDDDVQAHLELLTREYVERGLPLRDAQAAARRAFGGVDQMKEAWRDQRGFPAIDTSLQDLRYAARMLRRDPAFAAVAILSLAIGIGASTAAFSVFNAVMLRPLPVSEPSRLVLVQPQRRGTRYILFNPIYEALRARQTTLSGMFAADDTPYLKVIFDDEPTPVYVPVSRVSGSYFDVLGLTPQAGRLLTEQDDERRGPGDRCAAVISSRLWVRRFARSPAALDRTLRVGDRTCAIVGVAPATFESHQAGFAPDLWLPLRPLTDPKLLASRGMAFFSGVMGRVAPGVEIGRAEAELTTLYQQALAAQPQAPAAANQPRDAPADFTLRLAPGAQGFDALRRAFSSPLAIILGVVGVVLLIASLNVSNLLLARGAARLPELATRAALGAGRWRLVRQLATEGLSLAVLGGLLGLALARMAIPTLASQISLGYTTILIDAHPDARVLGLALVLTAASALVAGVLPALRLSTATLQSGLASGGRSTTATGHRLRRVLVTAQLAMSLLLVSAAGLLLRTIVHLAGVDPGFAPAHVVMLNVRDEAPKPSFGDVDDALAKARREERYRVIDARLNAEPGVRAASVSWLGLFSMQDLSLPLIDPDRPDQRPLAHVDYVSARYFDTMGMQILQGRGFRENDREGMTRVAVINETLARVRFGAEDPLGRRIALEYRGEDQRPFTVVGVVHDSKYNDLRDSRPNPMIWIPIAQAPFPISSIALRTEPGAEGSVARRAMQVLQETDADIMVRGTTTLAAQIAGKTSRERLLLGLSSGFASVAILLAAIGLYGTLAYIVNRRTREIGVRLAFGASRDAILRMIVGDALRLAAVALVVGVPLSLAVGYSLRAFLFGVTPTDPAALVGACLVLTIVTIAAAYLPARRAAAVDPIVALRCE